MNTARPSALSEGIINKELRSLAGWQLDNGKLFKKFEFSDFAEAMGFMVRAISFIETSNHHPEWFNVYNRVEVTLVTHDVAGSSKPAITSLDLSLAQHLNQIAP